MEAERFEPLPCKRPLVLLDVPEAYRGRDDPDLITPFEFRGYHYRNILERNPQDLPHVLFPLAVLPGDGLEGLLGHPGLAQAARQTQLIDER
jgi:hypothetical protein